MTRYYIEHDGRVYTVEREGRIDLPTEDEVEVPYEETTTRQVADHQIVYGQATLDDHPWDWHQKDALCHDQDATKLLHAAINASLFRPVVGAIARYEGKILLVEPARGVAKGHWTLPGGFVNAFEQPVDAAAREVKEETGVEVTGLELVGSFVYTHPGVPYPVLGLAYVGDALDDAVEIREEEIQAARWFEVAEAEGVSGGFAQSVLEHLGKEGHL